MIEKPEEPPLTFVRPGYEPLFEGAYSKHILPSRADEFGVRRMVDSVFTGGTGIGGTFAPFDARLLRQLLDHAPDPELLGVCDWQRGLRADEIAAIYGETPPTREAWLLRADEMARAWGRPLLGRGGLVDEVLGPDAPGNLPEPAVEG
jgi:hypothetical protein